MTPIYRIESDGVGLADAALKRLLSLSLVDAKDLDSDSFECMFDDAGSAIELPRTGAQLSVAFGYAETGLRDMGRFTVDEIELASPPQTLTIRARAANFRASLKATKTRSWHDTTLGTITRTIAQEHGYIPRVSADLAAVVIKHVDQTAESDIHFMTRLARQNGAIVKPTNGFLMVGTRASLKSTSGKTLPTIELSEGDLTSWRVTLPERGKYTAVTAHYHDTDGATRIGVTAGSGTPAGVDSSRAGVDSSPAYAMPRTYPTATQALNAAHAQLKAFGRGLGTLSLTLPMRPDLVAESAIRIDGVRTGPSGTWAITRVEHMLDASGFISQVDAEVPTP